MRYHVDWVQFSATILAIVCLAGAAVSMFVLPRQPWPVTMPLLYVATLAGCVVDARMEDHWREGQG